ncbi:MAG: SpoIVB peptidase [Oscillospiraceae bacterium]|nr:SpoIVB peptidase [Oscillospiraceae bacterium]
MRKTIKLCAFSAAVVCFFILGLICYYEFTLPGYFYVFKNEDLKLDTRFKITADSTAVFMENRSKPAVSIPDENISAGFSGTQGLTLKLFGAFPVKNARVQTIKRSMLVPGGNPFGVKMFTKGVMVVGVSDVETLSGVVNPAKAAGIKMGDIIYLVNGEKVSTNEEVAHIISRSGGNPVDIHLERKNKGINLTMVPALSKDDNKYKAGLWVRDSSAGIGTITFYDPTEGAFAGLGHGICDVDTGEILPLLSGEIVNVNIDSVQKSVAGTPGELRGSFLPGFAVGNLLLNDESGVYGQAYRRAVSGKAIPMALKQQVKPGSAKILTTIKGRKPKAYKIVIEKVAANSSVKTKNMIIRITDPELLEKAGGIVQGMSGSPIIQGGTLVGAVTHVFINDPVKGYGIFAENMLESQNSIGFDKAG